MANQLASSYYPDFSEADPPKPWGMESPNNNLALAILQKDIDQRAAATRVAYKGGASPTDYVQTAGYIGKHLIDQAVDSIKSGVTLPHDVAQGDVDPLSPEGIQRTLDLAGLMAGGGLAEKAGPGKLGSSPMRPAPKSEMLSKVSEPFYSAIDRVIDAGPSKASGSQWAATIKNAPGVKQEEIDWLGLNDMLAKHEGPVTREQLQDYIDQHKVQLGETWKDSHTPNDEGSFYLDDAETPKYTDYATPGAENYRELLLTLPTREKSNIDPSGMTMDEFDRASGRINNYRSSHWEEPNVLGHLRMSDRYLDVPSDADIKAIETKIANGLGYTPGSLASGSAERAVQKGLITPQEAKHVSQYWGWQNKYNSGPAKGALGNKSLFLEELQSDWHQAGRKEGYHTSVKPKYVVTGDGPWQVRTEDGRFVSDFNIKGAAQNAADDLNEGTGPLSHLDDAHLKKGVPDAPFKKTWPDLLLKRAVREAVDNGYDSISWTSGATQADRYDLSKQVDQVVADKNPDGSFELRAIPKDGSKMVTIKEAAEPKELDQLVGKDLAAKIVKDGGGQYSGVDLRVGGEGMKAFYDKELPARAKKLFKLDVTTEDVEGGYMQPDETVHIMRFTPEFKKQVQERGFPLFSSGVPTPGSGDDDQNLPASGSGAILRPGALRLVPVDHDPFARGGR